MLLPIKIQFHGIHKGLGGFEKTLRCGLGVVHKRGAEILMAHENCDGLRVRPSLQEVRDRSLPEIVNLETVKVGLANGREPDAWPEVGVRQRLTLGTHEQRLVRRRSCATRVFNVLRNDPDLLRCSRSCLLRPLI